MIEFKKYFLSLTYNKMFFEITFKKWNTKNEVFFFIWTMSSKYIVTILAWFFFSNLPFKYEMFK